MPRIPTPAEIQYMEKHIGDDMVPAILAVNVICTVAAYIGVAMRLVSRYIQRAGIKADDWSIVASLLLLTGFTTDLSVATAHGFGKHILQSTKIRSEALMSIVAEVLYCACMVCIKTSILCLYRRIFPQQWFRRALIATGTFNLLWFVAAFFGAVFQCVPISAQWDLEIHGYCISYGDYLLVFLVLTIATDLIILTLPMPLVWRIQTSRRKKWLITVTFMLGGFACIVSVVRLPFLPVMGTTADPSWDDVNGGDMLSTVELCIGILAACSATWRPLFSRSIRHSAACSATWRTLFSRSIRRSAAPTTRCREAPHRPRMPQGKSLNNNPEKIEMTIEMPERTKAPIRDDDGHELRHARTSEPGTSTDDFWYGSKDECC